MVVEVFIGIAAVFVGFLLIGGIITIILPVVIYNKLISIKKDKDFGRNAYWIMTVEELKIRCFVFTRTKAVDFIGSGTVWYRMPEFRRPGTCTEFELTNLFQKAKYEGLI